MIWNKKKRKKEEYKDTIFLKFGRPSTLDHLPLNDLNHWFRLWHLHKKSLPPISYEKGVCEQFIMLLYSTDEHIKAHSISYSSSILLFFMKHANTCVLNKDSIWCNKCSPSHILYDVIFPA